MSTTTEALKGPPATEAPKRKNPIEAEPRRKEQQPVELDVYLKQRCLAIDEENKEGRLERTMESMQAWLFYRGKHFQQVDRNLSVVDLRDKDDLFTANWTASLIDGLAAQWENSAPQLKMAARIPTDPDMAAVAKFAKKIADQVRNGFAKAYFRQSEAKFAALSRAYFRKTTVVRDEYQSMQVPQTRSLNVQPKGSFVCGSMDCMGTGPEESLQTSQTSQATGEQSCPHCGGKDLLIQPSTGGMEEADETTGYDSVPLMRINVELVDPNEVTVYPDRSRTVEQAHAIRQERYLKRYEVEDKYPKYELSEDRVASSGAQAQRTLESSNVTDQAPYNFDDTRNTSDTSHNRADDPLVFKEYWIEPVMYRRFRPAKTVTLCGMEIPGGKPLGKTFPKGLYMAWVGDKLVDIQEVDKDRVWTGAPYKVDPTTFYGKGSEDTIDPQYMFDEMINVIFGHMMRSGSPIMLTNPHYISRSHLTSPKQSLVIEIKKTPDDQQGSHSALDRALRVVQGGSLDTGAYNLIELLPKMLQQFTGAFQPLLGGPEKATDTYSGMALMLQQAIQQLTPALNLRAEEVEAPNAIQILEYVQETWTDEQYRAISGHFDSKAREMFRDQERVNIRRDLVVSVEPGSPVPRTKIERIAALDKLSEYIKNGMTGELLRYAADELDIPLDVDKENRAAHVAKQRLDLIRKLVELATMVGTAADEFGNPNMEAVYNICKDVRRAAVKPLTDEHAVMIDFYCEQLDEMADDDYVNPLEETCLEFRIEQHYFAMGLKQQFTNALQTMAIAPGLAMQKMMEKAEQDGQFQKEMAQQKLAGDQAAQASQENTQNQAALSAHAAKLDMAKKEHGALVDGMAREHQAAIDGARAHQDTGLEMDRAQHEQDIAPTAA